MDIEVIRELPSGAMAMPLSSLEPDVICSGCPSGKRCRHKCRRPDTWTPKYIHFPSGDQAAEVQAPSGPTCRPGDPPEKGTTRQAWNLSTISASKTHFLSGDR